MLNAGRFARTVRLPVAGLGLLMVWCSLFAGYVAKLGLGPWLNRLAGVQAVAAVLFWTVNALTKDPAAVNYRDERNGEPRGGAALTRFLGRSPIGWAVLAFGIWVAPALSSASLGRNWPGLLGLSWAMLYCAVTLVSNRVDPEES